MVQDPEAEKAAEEIAKQAKTLRHVETRAVDVNLDKFNEKYDRIAPQTPKTKNAVTKQKFTSRGRRGGFRGGKKVETEAQRLQRLRMENIKKTPLKVLIPDEITVGELAARMKMTAANIIKKLMGLGVMASISDTIDYDTAFLVASELGCAPREGSGGHHRGAPL